MTGRAEVAAQTATRVPGGPGGDDTVKVLLARPRPDTRSVNVQRFMVTEPLELEILAAHLSNLGHEVDVVDLVLERHKLAWFLAQKHYDLVGLTGYINHVHVIKALAGEVKRASPQTRVVVGGIHAESVPTDFIDSSIDHIVWANGPATMAELASGMSVAEGACLPGVWGSGKAKPASDHPRGLLPDRTSTAKYRSRYNSMHHESSAMLKTSYGCARACATGCDHDGSCSRRDLDEVMDELATIDEPHVFIVDDDFLSSPAGIQAFCDALDARGISKRFMAFARAEYVSDHPDDVRLLAAHGFEGLFLEVEPFLKTQLNDDRADQTEIEQAVQAVRVLEDAGVQCYTDLFTGMDWDRTDFDRLIAFLNQLEHPMVNIQPSTPMPGTSEFDEGCDQVSLARCEAERWDSAHLTFRPTELGPRAYYWQLLRAHYKTTANPSRRRYIKDRYGKRVYRRMIRGAVGNTWQYLKLMVRPG